MKHDGLFKLTVGLGIGLLFLFTVAFFFAMGLYVWSSELREKCNVSLWKSEAFNYLGL